LIHLQKSSSHKPPDATSFGHSLIKEYIWQKPGERYRLIGHLVTEKVTFLAGYSDQHSSVVRLQTFILSTKLGRKHAWRIGIQPNKGQNKETIYKSFFKSDKRRYSYIVVHGLNAYFVKDHTNSKKKYTEDDIVNMINILTDNIFIEFGGRIFQQTVGIPLETNCAPLLADLFLHSYEAEFVQELRKRRKKN